MIEQVGCQDVFKSSNISYGLEVAALKQGQALSKAVLVRVGLGCRVVLSVLGMDVYWGQVDTGR